MNQCFNTTGGNQEDSGAFLPSEKRIERLAAFFRKRHLAGKKQSTKTPDHSEVEPVRTRIDGRVVRKGIGY